VPPSKAGAEEVVVGSGEDETLVTTRGRLDLGVGESGGAGSVGTPWAVGVADGEVKHPGRVRRAKIKAPDLNLPLVIFFLGLTLMLSGVLHKTKYVSSIGIVAALAGSMARPLSLAYELLKHLSLIQQNPT